MNMWGREESVGFPQYCRSCGRALGTGWQRDYCSKCKCVKCSKKRHGSYNKCLSCFKRDYPELPEFENNHVIADFLEQKLKEEKTKEEKKQRKILLEMDWDDTNESKELSAKKKMAEEEDIVELKQIIEEVEESKLWRIYDEQINPPPKMSGFRKRLHGVLSNYSPTEDDLLVAARWYRNEFL